MSLLGGAFGSSEREVNSDAQALWSFVDWSRTRIASTCTRLFDRAAASDSFRLADNPSGVSCSFLTGDGRRYVCCTRTVRFTL